MQSSKNYLLKTWANLSASTLKCKHISALALVLCLCVPSPVFAVDSPVNRLQTRAVADQTVRALQLIDQRQWKLARDVVAGTRDPLASKLYYWEIFTNKGDFQNFGRLAQFIRKNPEWPGVSALRLRAEKDMPSSLTSAEVLAWFTDYPPKTASGVDRYMRALSGSGKTPQAKKFLSDWWATTTLSRDDQRFIFKKYAAFLDRAAHLRRFDAMLLRGQKQNASALAGVLGKGYPQLAQARIALAAEKKNVNGLINAVPARLQNDAGLMYERLRWRRRNDLNEGAMEILHKAPRTGDVHNRKDWWRERHIMARRLIEKKHYESAYLLSSGHIQTPGGFQYAQAEWLSGWLSLRFLNKPAQAYQHFEALHANVKTPVSKSRGSYWAGRAASGFNDTSITLQWFQKAAQHSTTFYGQLAGAELGLSGSLPSAKPPKLSAQDKLNFQRKELVQAAKLFARAGQRKESSRFLRAFVESEGSAKAYKYAAEYAIENGQTHDAVKISKRATKKGLFLTAQSYPTAAHFLKGIDLEWALIHAIIRQESTFDVKAQSPVGAKGLMQLMPATAKETARKIGIPHQNAWLTTNPQHNVTLGSRYLSDMVRRYGGAYPMAIAAYNAGPGRVDKWIKIFGDPRKGQIDWIDWIELIPIYETRNYVQRVMESVYIYRLRLKNVQSPPTTPIHIAFVTK